ncbi:4-(cytidine 5'-diphospho)-2-C-methyl-D-erythritol kinase [uncultured Roseobacter sp.]|uniref:4-(cytidine 5'-diphospho)-2-C-methyl-D-erythritol kinase n=1 Tax=uncultured Roseobacter sp. TaxID=114847 RepID=UPI00262E3545|nr:4-(cytidine 5'-diphospho)-2-C-methyl-D-erythritol kinase [uncultured Roseobacter sp.]
MRKTEVADTRLRVFAPAKVNLTLHVTGQRPDGYHLLDSLVMFADLGDVLELTAGPEMMLDVTGPFAADVPDDTRNLAWRAAALAGWSGHITVQKNLPHGAGIGGGSSDAGAVLRALQCDESGLSLGADVPVCRFGRAAQISGIGDRVDGVDVMPLFVVLVNPGAHCATPAVFSLLARKSNPPMDNLPPKGAGGAYWLSWLRAQRNDLEEPACALSPVIADVLETLGGTKDVLLARMSGSGSTCFGLYPTLAAARSAAHALSASHPAWWVVPTTLS